MAALPFIAAAAALAGGAVELTSSSVVLSGTAAAAGGGAVDGFLGSPVALTSTTAAAGGGAVNGTLLTQFSGTAQSLAGGEAILSTTHSFSGRASAVADGSILAFIDGQGLTVEEAVKAVLPLFGFSCCGDCLDACLRASIMEALNAALQQIFARAHRLDFFNRTSLEVTITGGANSATLQQSVQNILKPVRLQTGKQALMELESIHDIDHYAALYHGGAAYAPSSPRAFFLQGANQNKGDNVALTLYVAPTPVGNTVLLVDVSLEPPRYTWSDVTAGTPLEMPHRYAETLLLPLVKHWAMSHRNFVLRALEPAIKDQYAIARDLLGLVDPVSPETHAKKQKTEPA